MKREDFNLEKVNKFYRISLIENDIENKHDIELAKNIKGEFLDKDENPNIYYSKIADVVIQHKIEIIKLYLEAYLQVFRKSLLDNSKLVNKDMHTFVDKVFDEAEIYLKESINRELHHDINMKMFNEQLYTSYKRILTYVDDKLNIERNYEEEYPDRYLGEWVGTKIALVNDLRGDRERGIYESYAEAYRWAEENITVNGKPVNAENLESLYYKTKSTNIDL